MYFWQEVSNRLNAARCFGCAPSRCEEKRCQKCRLVGAPADEDGFFSQVQVDTTEDLLAEARFNSNLSLDASQSQSPESSWQGLWLDLDGASADRRLSVEEVLASVNASPTAGVSPHGGVSRSGSQVAFHEALQASLFNSRNSTSSASSNTNYMSAEASIGSQSLGSSRGKGGRRRKGHRRNQESGSSLPVFPLALGSSHSSASEEIYLNHLSNESSGNNVQSLLEQLDDDEDYSVLDDDSGVLEEHMDYVTTTTTNTLDPEDHMSGWLLKKKRNVSRLIDQVAVSGAESCAQVAFWRRRFFELGPDSLVYYAGTDTLERTSSNGDVISPSDQKPRGVFALDDLDEVLVKKQQVRLHFASHQWTGASLRPRASLDLWAETHDEAARWANCVRKAAARKLRSRLPRDWDAMAMLAGNEEPVRMVARVPAAPSFTKVLQRLMDYCFICKRTKDRGRQAVPWRLEVLDVTRVQNSVAWVKYTKAKERVHGKEMERYLQQGGADGCDLPEIRQQLQPEVRTSTHADPHVARLLGGLDKVANEHWLFHGTTAAAAEGIAHRDFRLDLAGIHRGTLYGKGVYLAECSSKADEYAEEDSDGVCRMLLCRALLGSILVDSSKQPGHELAQRCRNSYDSLVGDRWRAVGTFREFILYNHTQVYPAYIITYRRVSQADLLRQIGEAAQEDDLRVAVRLIPHVARLAETHPDDVVRYRVSMLLAAHSAFVLSACIECLRDRRDSIRRIAVTTLGQIGAHAASLLPGNHGLTTEDSSFRKTAANRAVPALVRTLQDSCSKVREASAISLRKYGVYATPAGAALRACLHDVMPGVRAEAAAALGHIGGKNSHLAVPLLMELLEDQEAQVRKTAACALGDLGSVAHASLPALLCRLTDGSEDVRQAVAVALGCLLPFSRQNKEEAIEKLVARLEDACKDVVKAAASALGKLGAAASGIVPALAQCLKDPSPDVRQVVVIALGQLGDAATAAVPALIVSLKDSDPQVRKEVVTTMGKIGASSSAALLAMIDRVKDINPEVRKAAVLAIGSVATLGKFQGSSSSSAVLASAEHVLAEHLQDTSEDVRKAVKVVLRQLQQGGQPEVSSRTLADMFKCLSHQADNS